MEITQEGKKKSKISLAVRNGAITLGTVAGSVAAHDVGEKTHMPPKMRLATSIVGGSIGGSVARGLVGDRRPITKTNSKIETTSAPEIKKYQTQYSAPTDRSSVVKKSWEVRRRKYGRRGSSK